MKQTRLGSLVAGMLAGVALMIGSVSAADWPAYKADAARSSVTTETLAFPLVQVWGYEPCQAPSPAWPEPGKELHRIDFDYAFQPVIAEGRVYFGSSADDTVRALDVASGQTKWQFTAGGPVRFAPAIVDGKCYVASDDGFVYCLDTASGEPIWQFRAAPGPDQLLGNGRMISRWPLRSGVLVADGVVYVSAGMWPSQGIYVYALEAATGRKIWCNDSSGCMYIDLPHPGASAFTGVCPQGYLLASQDALLIPTGRSVPAAYDRKTGRLLYYRPAPSKQDGGSWATLAGDLFFNQRHGGGPDIDINVGEAEPRPEDGMLAYSLETGDKKLHLSSKHRVLVTGDMLYAVGAGEVQAVDLEAWKEKLTLTGCVKWSTPCERTYCLALADQALLLGGRGSITALDVAKGEKIWDCEVDGQVRGFAIANRRLVAATDKGTLLCFEQREIAVPAMQLRDRPTWRVSVSGDHIKLAAGLIRQTGIDKGYALVVAQLDCRLAMALASQTDLHVVSTLAGAAQVDAERERLLTTGFYGSRLAVQELVDPAKLPYAPYFASVVVASGNLDAASVKELYRVLRPCGGALCFPGSAPGMVRQLAEKAGVPKSEVSDSASGPMVVRGPLAGAGEWRYQWADGGRTGIGKESRLRLPLDVLWFGGLGPDRMMSRHWGTSTPLSVNGRVFVTGQHHVICFDAYTGLELWSRAMADVGRKGAVWRSSNFVADDDSVYVTVGSSCYRLAQTTGNTLSVYRLPDAAAEKVDPAAESAPVDVEWPRVWQLFGPLPKDTEPIARDLLKTIPKQIAATGKTYAATPLATVNGFLDFTNLYGGYGLKPLEPGVAPGPYPRPGTTRDRANVGTIVYAFAKIRCAKAGRLTIGAGADWWMQWYLDGKPIYDTLAPGNRKHPYAITNHVFSTEVTAGDHVLAAMVKAGSLGWCLISAGGALYEPHLKFVEPGTLCSWGYLSVAEQMILGTYESARPGGSVVTSLFALDKDDGSARWVWRGELSIANAGLAFGDGQVFVLDTTPWHEIQQAKRRGEEPEVKQTLVALDLATGAERWRTADLPETWSQLQYADGVVVVNAQAAYDAKTGRPLWQQEPRPERVPLIWRNWVIAQPRAFDLRTGQPRMAADLLSGEQRPWQFARAYGCGSIVGCEDLLFFRSGSYGFYDLANEGTTSFGGVRPGCSVNIIPANGLVVVPEGSSACTCSYNFQTSVALVPGPSRGDLWYVFEGESAEGALKRCHVNFGAPGDRRDAGGAAWLGFPRPNMPRSCQVPVTVKGEAHTFYYHPAAAAAITGTDHPWLYTSGLRGPAKIVFDLLPARPVIVPTGTKAPTIDGKLEDACWRGAEPVPFDGDAHLLDPKTTLFIRRGAENLYFAYRRKVGMRNGRPIPFTAKQTGDNAQCWRDDDFELFVTDSKRKVALQFAVSCGGGRFEGYNYVPNKSFSDLAWTCEWAYAVQRGANEWTAELAVPLKVLVQERIDPTDLQINATSHNLSGQGARYIYLAPPNSNAFGKCQMFAPIVDKPVKMPERAFTLRLHFADPDGAKPGRRVCDVLVQGKPVLKGLDIAKEAGREGRALIKTLRGVAASEELTIELTSPDEDSSEATAPVLCGLELHAEKE